VNNFLFDYEQKVCCYPTFFSPSLLLNKYAHFNHNFSSSQVLSFSTESDQQRWLEAVSPPVSENPEESAYEELNCPQVTTHPYVARQPDEVADDVNVPTKTNDGKI